ncbi:hypothetical protein MXB_1160 [Myxobolus squamalis]|nr:hypothetical protein MXB_1160 [Myxobolus squamalis]
MENSDFKQKFLKFKQDLKNEEISMNSNHKRAKHTQNYDKVAGKFSNYAIKFMGIHIVDNLLRIYLLPLARDFQVSDEEYNVLISDDAMSKNERIFFLKQVFKKSHQEIFNKIYQSHKNWNDFYHAIMSAKESFMPEIPLKLSLTKANEKASKEIHLNYILGVLDVYLSFVSPTLDDCSTAFQNCLSLSFTHKTGSCIIFPPRLINVVVDRVTPFLDLAIQTLIQALHAKISSLYLDKKSDILQLPDLAKANLDLLVKLTIETTKTLLK